MVDPGTRSHPDEDSDAEAEASGEATGPPERAETVESGAPSPKRKPARRRRRTGTRRKKSTPETRDPGSDTPPDGQDETPGEAGDVPEASVKRRRRRARSRGRGQEPGPSEPAAGPAVADETTATSNDGETTEEAEVAAGDIDGGEAPPPAEPIEKVLLVNATDAEEVRIALIEDGQLEELYVEGAEERTATGNVYRGRVQNVEKAIGAAFVELGRGQTGFLHVSDLPDREPGAKITDLVEPGQEIVVQITRDRIGRKGPALTGRVSLAGRYLVLLTSSSRSGISRRIGRGRTRDRARRALSRLDVPEGMGLIVRTVGDGAGLPDFQRDLAHLLRAWERLQERASQPGPVGILRAESDLAERSVRDIMPSDVARIVTDREDVAARIRSLLGTWYGPLEQAQEEDDRNDREVEDDDPDDAENESGAEDAEAGFQPEPQVEIHEDPMPLFHAYGVEQQLEEAFRRTLRLPSGGSVVIDPTEALVSIDVNSGRSTEEEDPDATALQTNLEAIEVVARQLRLRDLGGLVVIDLIDMRERKSGRTVEKALKRALARDRARIRVGHIDSFGCVIMSRQRIRQALTRVTHEECAACGGTGRRRHMDGLGLRVLRELQARVARARGRGGVAVRVPKAVHDWILRHRGRVLRDLEGACTGPVRLEVDDRLPMDGWAMKGLPATGKGTASSGRRRV